MGTRGRRGPRTGYVWSNNEDLEVNFTLLDIAEMVAHVFGGVVLSHSDTTRSRSHGVWAQY